MENVCLQFHQTVIVKDMFFCLFVFLNGCNNLFALSVLWRCVLLYKSVESVYVVLLVYWTNETWPFIKFGLQSKTKICGI